MKVTEVVNLEEVEGSVLVEVDSDVDVGGVEDGVSDIVLVGLGKSPNMDSAGVHSRCWAAMLMLSHIC